MIKNKKAQGVFVGIMIAIVLFISVIVLIPLLKDQIILARSPSYLDCDNTSITVAQKGTCILVDIYMFYFVGAAIAVSIGAISIYGFKKRS